MPQFVLDNSVAMRWLQPTVKREDQRQALAVLQQMHEAAVIVPALWWYEVISVLATLRHQGAVDENQIESFMHCVDALTIVTDPVSKEITWYQVYPIATQYGLSGYDAAYLELAIRKQLPLATLDKSLRKAAKKADVSLF